MMRYIFILLFVLSSCGARKAITNIQETKLVDKTVVTDTLSIKTASFEATQDTTHSVELSFEPIDSTKEFVVEGKIYKNVRFKSIKTKKGISTFKKEEASLNRLKTTSNDIVVVNKTKDKIVDRKEVNYFKMWLWLLVIIALVVAAREIKKRFIL